MTRLVLHNVGSDIWPCGGFYPGKGYISLFSIDLVLYSVEAANVQLLTGFDYFIIYILLMLIYLLAK